jgi:F-type H+-transporting ATPase subunit b
MLGFDVPTFVFQIVNFLILLAILARFFYRPILQVMQQRQDRIDARIEDAEARARQADEERARLAQQSTEASRQAAALLESARNEAARERQRLIEEARGEAAELVEESRKSAAMEEQAALDRLSNRLSESATRIAASLIRDTSGEALHASLLERLHADGFGLDEAGREQAKLDFQEEPGALVVESAYPLDAKQRTALRSQTAKLLGRPVRDLRLEVRENPDLVAGVRIVAGAVVIDFSLKHLLEELSQQEGSA